MSFSVEQGYIPNTIEELIDVVRENINTQFGTTYTSTDFLGTNFYKYFYALIQRLQENEVKTSEIVLKLQQYFDVTNEMIQRPKTTHPGIIDVLLEAGYTASTQAPQDSNPGEVSVCVDVDDGAEDYAETKLEICTILSTSIVAGVVSLGTEEEEITMSNLQAFDFKYFLPDRQRTYLRLTITISENNQYDIPADLDIKETLLENVLARYKLGRNFEPQTYFSIVDAPWAATILLEYSDDNSTWVSTVADLNFDDLYEFDIDDITLVQS